MSGVHCEHTSSAIELLENGRLRGRDTGDPIGFVVEFENGFKGSSVCVGSMLAVLLIYLLI